MALTSLIGLAIVKAVEVEDYVQIEFSDHAILSVFNSLQCSAAPLSEIEGKVVESVCELAEKIVIAIEDDNRIEIGLRNEDYFGPEAMTLDRGGEPTVVWN